MSVYAKSRTGHKTQPHGSLSSLRTMKILSFFSSLHELILLSELRIDNDGVIGCYSCMCVAKAGLDTKLNQTDHSSLSSMRILSFFSSLNELILLPELSNDNDDLICCNSGLCMPKA